ARLDAVRACHDGGGYSEADLEILFLGTRAQWAREHPPPHAEADGASASPRPAQVLRSTAAADSSNGNKNGRRHSPQRSGVRPISATRVSAGRDRGIVPAYGYFNFSPNKIAVPKLLEGRNDLITWTESLEPKLEIAGLKKFVDENVLAPDEEDVELWSEFRMAHLWTFMANYVVLTKQRHRMGQHGKSGGGGGGGRKSSNTKSLEGADRGKSTKGHDHGSSGSCRGGRRYYICGDLDHLSYDCPDRDESDDDQRGSHGKSDSSCRRRDNQPRKEKPALEIP
ncbi:unnamed protein product, partial [Closterium sp. NIES-53]